MTLKTYDNRKRKQDKAYNSKHDNKYNKDFPNIMLLAKIGHLVP